MKCSICNEKAEYYSSPLGNPDEPVLCKKHMMEVIKMGEKDFKEATSGDMVKLENEGDSIQGTYLGIEQSKQYKDSFALKVRVGEDTKVVFVNNIVADLIATNSIIPGSEIKLEYLGMKDNKAGTFKYKDYKLYFK